MRVVVGRIGRAHGIRGEVSVEPRTDEPERRFAPGSSVFSGSRTLTIVAARHHSGRLLVRFTGVDDRNAAEALRGLLLEVDIDPDELPEDPDEFYDHQLEGLEVRSAGEVVGTVSQVVHLPAQDLLLVKLDAREVYVPFVTEIVPVVDVRGGFVEVADVPGLLDPDGADVVPTDEG
ncbi:ribosome maturation factor RimM [Aeromicrobium sp. IC_218]|nr:ribosome maturation factor RimM [Aeromicrobium sp. IC_218]